MRRATVRCLVLGSLLALLPFAALPASAQCTQFDTVVADVVAIDQPFFWNRLGAVQPQGMMFALRNDVEPEPGYTTLTPGHVRLKAYKRPRPLVLRMHAGGCLEIHFENLLFPTKPLDLEHEEQPATRAASVHVVGLELVSSILDDGSNVGANPSSLVLPGGTATYLLYAEREGQHVLHSGGAMTGGEGDGGSLNAGLFGAVNVEPKGSQWYRSQITRRDITLGTTTYTTTAQPVVDYTAKYPSTDPERPNLPIFSMLNGRHLVHSDLTAIIVPAAGTYPINPVYPDRDQPFREFTLMYHDEIGAVQAFPIFEDPKMKHTLTGSRDAFAINYGTGGIGAEILANRLGVGPEANCTECKFEEFFLTSWAVGDPAMVVDIPANAPCTIRDVKSANSACLPPPGPKATKAFYPDDPSNVYHSYLEDHVKMRILHGGSKEHHIHHLHAHQWVFDPDSDNSAYLDSQALGPGSGFTLEIAHNGSGNRNQTVGDSIFHCHFYPHFAMGMWSLWRVHDVLELGTKLDASGIPVAGARALPDGEIAAGTPIPAIVPLPGKAMAPLPQASVSIVGGQVQITGAGNPGYPFFIPGVAGHRPPHPPLDTLDDGGLPRHVITSAPAASTFFERHDRLSFEKILHKVQAQQVPETGTAVELAAMQYHAVRNHPSFTPGGVAASFTTNGLAPVPGAPYADPCIDDNGNPVGKRRLYKAADIQMDVVLNKKGWHFPQQRFISLWEDVNAFKFGNKPPEPLFFRGNTDDCIEYHLTNLVPNIYELDDFEVRTPTDILGQHIHLVKFDVTSSDGAGNGWNYEDGTFSPDEVRERIIAINAGGGLVPPGGGVPVTLAAKVHPFFGPGPDENSDGTPDWIGAQTTVQRWYADNTLNIYGKDRTLRTVFTHDHFGPSTHQQAGLYAGLVIEPQGSAWFHAETGVALNTRPDGGPTTWEAIIEAPTTTTSGEGSYREFLLEFADFQHAYLPGSVAKPDPVMGWSDPVHVINPSAKEDAGLPKLLQKTAVCPISGDPLPCPEIISLSDVGTMSVNYRNETFASRVYDPATGTQAAGVAGDLSYAMSSSVTRVDPALNVQPAFYAPLTGGLNPTDPYTPLMRAYENDRVQVRVLVGAHEEGHNFSIHGIKWLFEPSEVNSGYKGSQMMGISEHFEFIVPQLIKPSNPTRGFVDYAYLPGSSVDDLWNGLWGLVRVYTGGRPDLATVSTNPNGKSFLDPGVIGTFDGVCPTAANVRLFDVTAVAARTALAGGTIIYNGRTDGSFGPLEDPTGILYVRTSDLDPLTGKLRAGVPVEPLILRARAGECIKLTLTNALPSNPFDLAGWNTLPMIIENFNANDILPSNEVGLHPQLLFYDVSRSDGANVGFNGQQTVAPGSSISYKWYAGDVRINPNGTVTTTPIEFGATNLISSDRIKHSNKGAIGALIIEPPDASWVEDAASRAQATVSYTDANGTATYFREAVALFQNDVNLRMYPAVSSPFTVQYGTPVPNLAGIDDAEDSAQKAINYRTEPLWHRMQYAADTPLTVTRDFDFSNAFSNSLVGADPETPIFTAHAGDPVRFRVLEPGGHARNTVFSLHGHVWEQEPYVKSSTRLGHNPESMWEGSRMGHGPTNHFDALLQHGAGGTYGVIGDYLYRDFVSFHVDGGMWGLFRVVP